MKDAKAWQLHEALAGAVMAEISPEWTKRSETLLGERRAFYLSAEFLVGRLVNNNVLCLGVYDELEKLFAAEGASLGELEEIEDAALGNGGLGRLAACYLD
ncbi:MAG: glycogen/starch/alpha-glucan phosphorylase, partial [Ruminococcaceae bacterium]|nr:glycogen/starch/alpha-glucan phosphorylase [Oscillospiraceae bacterium]